MYDLFCSVYSSKMKLEKGLPVHRRRLFMSKIEAHSSPSPSTKRPRKKNPSTPLLSSPPGRRRRSALARARLRADRASPTRRPSRSVRMGRPSPTDRVLGATSGRSSSTASRLGWGLSSTFSPFPREGEERRWFKRATTKRKTLSFGGVGKCVVFG